MTGYDTEKKLAESRLRHEAEFRRKHKVSQAEWDLAEEMAASLQSRLHAEFWEVYDRGDDRRPGGPALPGSGRKSEMREPRGASEKAKGTRLREPGTRRSQRR